MITSPNGKGVIITGGKNDIYKKREHEHSNALIELKDISKEWILLNQTLQYARQNPIVLPIPDKFTTCKTKT